ncbi:nucleotidyltransferase family protein [Paenibacillus sp. J2TS4]|uniref:nucleotidyltransferase family protein n=1 Tax=Paenibacillus sp. J2TS4 TaxID=2807194 RepID=UPI001B1D08A7|nr:nucleotidyltransferase family protein [Paenibacillus sp. J2TS4]GIP31664.1 nitrate reductase [Paenibacillus sp. J2TS4]
MREKRLKQYLYEHERLWKDLRKVRELDLPQCYIAAGYIRNYIWDKLHGFEDRQRHNDIDVVYYDKDYASEERDIGLEKELIEQTGDPKWSVKNQARMHIRNGEKPYLSTIDALSRWPETVTALGGRLDANDELDICSPYGLEDLFNLVVRRSPLFKDKELYLNRVHKKEWKKHWPLITILDE